MNVYYLTGTCCKKGALNTTGEKFSACENAPDAQKAMDKARESLYNKGYEHILFRTCTENGKRISMLAALGLE